MKESAKMPTIKFHQPKDFIAPGPCPMGNRTQRGRERETEGRRERACVCYSKRVRERERAMKRKQMGKGRGFTTGDGLLLTPIFAKRKKDGEITLRGPQSITTNIK